MRTNELVLDILDNGIKNTFKVTIFCSSKLQGDRDLEGNHKLTGTHWVEFTIQTACSRQFKELSFYKPIRI